MSSNMIGNSFINDSSIMSNGISGFVMIIFVIVIGMFIYVIVKGISQWNQNNNSPVLTVEAIVVAKREDVSVYHHNNNDIMTTTSSTDYYITFEVESGDRMELHVSAQEFGMLAENDKGKLTFQGTRYLGFERAV